MTRPSPATAACRGALSLLACALLTQCGEKSPRGETAHAHTKAIVDLGPRPPASPALRKARDYVSATLKQHGWVTRTQEFTAFTPKGNVTFVNLVARHAPGGDNEDVWSRPVEGLLLAHLDSKHFDDFRFVGADDAASAVGLILVLAEDLARSPARAGKMELAFFDGEEAFGQSITPSDGLYGSRYYAAQWRRSPTKPTFGILLDMVGHRDLSIKLPSDSPPALAEFLFRVADREKVRSHFTMGRFPIIDDHVPLNDAGIPTIDIIGDFASKNWWHTPRDTLDIISPKSLEISHRVVHGMLEELLP